MLCSLRKFSISSSLIVQILNAPLCHPEDSGSNLLSTLETLLSKRYKFRPFPHVSRLWEAEGDKHTEGLLGDKPKARKDTWGLRVLSPQDSPPTSYPIRGHTVRTQQAPYLLGPKEVSKWSRNVTLKGLRVTLAGIAKWLEHQPHTEVSWAQFPVKGM